MRFSERVLSVDLSGIRKLFEGAPPGSINLGLGQPDFDTPDSIKEAAITAIKEGKTGYTHNAGLPELREEISKKLFKENSISITPDQILVTAGGSEALHIVLQALVERGDRVLHPEPGFVAYSALGLIAGGKPDGIPLDETLHINVEAAKEKIKGAGVIILNSPANPTGMVEPEETVRAIVEYADDCNVPVISDEVYEHFIYEKKHTSAARFGDNVVTVNAFSKTYAMTGWRLGYLAASEECVNECMKVHQYCQACATSISQYAGLAALRGPQDMVTKMRDEYKLRRDIVYEGLSRAGLRFNRPEGAFYMFIPLEESVYAKIIQSGVILVPGKAFGERGAGFARMSYAQNKEILSSAVQRMTKVISGC